MCEAHPLLLLLLPLLLHLQLFLRLLFRDAARHFMRRTSTPRMNALSLPLYDWLASVLAARLWAPWRAS
jgi:hypothetical protein